MRKITYSSDVHAPLDTIWKLLIEKVEQPQSYMPGINNTRILQHYGSGVLREIKGEGMVIKEKVEIDKMRGEIHYFLLEHPLFSGRVVNRVVASSAQSPVAPQVLTIEMEWAPKDEEAERLIQTLLPEQIQSEVLTVKQRAEAMDREESLPLSTPYAFGITLALTLGDAKRRVLEVLNSEGFTVLSEADITQKFREKLHKESRNCLILGICNPGLAYQAIGVDINIAALLPCNLALYSLSDMRTVVIVSDPTATMSLAGKEKLDELALHVKQSLQRVIKSL